MLNEKDILGKAREIALKVENKEYLKQKEVIEQHQSKITKIKGERRKAEDIMAGPAMFVDEAANRTRQKEDDKSNEPLESLAGALGEDHASSIQRIIRTEHEVLNEAAEKRLKEKKQ